MRIEDYPENDEIQKTQKAIEDLMKTDDIGALKFAEHDLNTMLQKRKEWLEKNKSH